MLSQLKADTKELTLIEKLDGGNFSILMVGGSQGEKMPRKRHSEERIIYALKQIEGGAKGLEMRRELGISEATLYNWKKRYAGMGSKRTEAA